MQSDPYMKSWVGLNKHYYRQMKPPQLQTQVHN